MGLINIRELNNGKVEVHLELPTIEFIEEGIHHVYSPELDLYGYGKSLKSARESFQETLVEFIEHSFPSGGFQSELIRLGWRFRPADHGEYEAPDLTSLMARERVINDLWSQGNFNVGRREMRVAAHA